MHDFAQQLFLIAVGVGFAAFIIGLLAVSLRVTLSQRGGAEPTREVTPARRTDEVVR